MKFFKNSKILFIVLILLLGCNKEEDYHTSGELIAQELKVVINENQISLCSVFAVEYYDGMPYLTQKHDKERFSLNSTFIVVNDIYYNLEQLDKFEVEQENGSKYLNVYFIK